MAGGGCGCGGAARRALTVTQDANGNATVEPARVPGMPRYTVTDGSKVEEFATYNDARLYKASHGGKLRAV